LVLLPPSYSRGGYTRYSLTKTGARSVVDTPDLNGNNLFRVGRILVDVFNVNGSGQAMSYEARLVGVDGAADLAVLSISCDTKAFPWNENSLSLRKCHPYLKFGDSAKYRDTEKVMLVGDLVSRQMTMGLSQGGYDGGLMQSTLRGFVKGKVYNHRFVDPTGYAQPELVIVDANVYACSSGAPIINKYGKVIGMQTLAVPGMAPGYEGFTLGLGVLHDTGNNVPLGPNYVPPVLPSAGPPPVPAVPASGAGALPSNPGYRTFGDGLVGGPSQRSFIHSVYKLLKTECGRKFTSVVTKTDDLGNFNYVTHAYLGVAWELVTGLTFSSYVDSEYGVAVGQYDGPNLVTPHTRPARGPANKTIVGVRIRALAGQNDAAGNPLVKYLFVPGASTADANVPGFDNANFVDSPLNLGSNSNSGVPAAPNDIIYAINGMPVGGTGTQGAPSLALWCLSSTSPVQLAVRKWEDNSTSKVESYDPLDVFNFTLPAMPLAVNYPWYKYQSLPLAGLFGYAEPNYKSAMPLYNNSLILPVAGGVTPATAPFYPSI
jgi:S1-C subfamily serine protease